MVSRIACSTPPARCASSFGRRAWDSRRGARDGGVVRGQPEARIVKKALITSTTGQDDSYRAEFVLGKGYEVHGVIRRSSSLNTTAPTTSTRIRTPVDG